MNIDQTISDLLSHATSDGLSEDQQRRVAKVLDAAVRKAGDVKPKVTREQWDTMSAAERTAVAKAGTPVVD